MKCAREFENKILKEDISMPVRIEMAESLKILCKGEYTNEHATALGKMRLDDHIEEQLRNLKKRSIWRRM